MLHIIARIGAQGARGYAVEYAGEAIAALSAEARMTLCNMTVEAGARAALIAPDATTLDYVCSKVRDLDAQTLDAARTAWSQLRSDADAHFDVEHRFDATRVAPFVTWGTSPDQAIPVDGRIPDADATTDRSRRSNDAQGARLHRACRRGAPIEGTSIDRVFIGSCTNARIEDLRAVAAVVRGRKVASTVRAMVVPGSGMVRDQAEREGIAQVLIDAGFEWRQPGCSMCLAMNDDVLAPGERCASTTNRNFEGRQGRDSKTHLMSPAMAAAAAIAGRIVDIRKELTHG